MDGDRAAKLRLVIEQGESLLSLAKEVDGDGMLIFLLAQAMDEARNLQDEGDAPLSPRPSVVPLMPRK